MIKRMFEDVYYQAEVEGEMCHPHVGAAEVAATAAAFEGRV